jgi:riboflavin synthase
MFTGIIETTGQIVSLEPSGTNCSFWVKSSLAPELKPDQSLSHNGVCLTVEAINGPLHKVTAIAETLAKTNLSEWKEGTLVNLERCLQMNGRIDGHIVQGHVDCTALCTKREEKDGSWEYQFSFPRKMASLIIEKGSISINGISLTAFRVRKKSFRVAIIPYTFSHTNMPDIVPGSTVNIEFDIIGKYLLRTLSL